MHTQGMRIQEYVNGLKNGETLLLPENETWPEWVIRSGKTGVINEINEETYDYFLDVLPPRWMCGSMFAFAEGCGPWRLFWRHAGRFFCRQLDDHETRVLLDIAAGR